MEKQNQNIATAIKGNNVTLTNCPVTIHAGDAASAMSDGDNKKNETAEPSTSGPPVPKKKRKTAKPRQKKTPEIDEGYVEISEGIFMNNKEPLKEGTQIFRAYQEHGAAGRRPLAVKRISPCTDKNVREVQHLIKLASHPNIVQIIQSKEPQSDVRTLYIIMELCSSQNLQDFLNENRIKNIPFDSKAAMSFSKQLVDGMKFVHSSGIIHNDIKPENVLLLEDKQHIKITDFGLGKQLRVGRSLTKVTSQGSDGYRAPETYKSGTHTISKQADIFSLGITMFFVCSNGKHPFGDDEDLLNYNIKHNKGRDLTGLMIPETKMAEFLDLINKMLQHDPLHRPTIIEVSQHPFFTNELAFPKESRLQSDSAAIYSGIIIGKVRGSATIDSKAKDVDENAATADTGSLNSTAPDPKKEQDEKSAKGTEENIATSDGTVQKNATLGSSTQTTKTKTADVKKNLQEYGIRAQRFTRDFRFGKEWEDAPLPVDVTVAGGHFSQAVLGTQTVNKNTVVHQHDAPLPVDVTVAGGNFSQAVLGTQTVNKNTVVHQHDSPPPVDVTVAGGHFGHAVVGTQIVNRNTVVHQHAIDVDSPALPPGHFRLNSKITVSEYNPINRDSRIYRAKLHSEVLGDWKIAVKILSYGKRQLREAQNHFKVPHHKNIVERILTDTFKYQGQPCIYIAMEQCDPQNLNAYVVSLAESNAPYDAEMFMSFAFQIATGLEFLHRCKILNRDLKPENILLSVDKKIAKIADFGMSKEMTGEASTVSALQPGTDGWRSPEILQNVEHITLASDMFSLGLILNFLWSYGKHAFGDDHHAWNYFIKRGEHMNLDGLKIPNANDAKRLLRSLLSQNPTERPSALEVLRDIVFEAKDIDKSAATSDTQSLDSTTLDPAKEQDDKSERRTNIADVRKNLQRYGVRVQRFTRDFRFGKEWEGRFSDQKVTIMHFNEDDVVKYENAVDVLTNLKHKNIMHFIKEIPKLCVIITEFCEYGTLKEYLACGDGKRAELSELLRMAAQVASGMDFLHRKKYVHCDLRARNVTVTAHLHCKISVFGMARHVGENLGENAILTRWAAQEVIQKGYVSFKSDVWSFGVVLWEIVTRGREPYPRVLIRNVDRSICVGHRMLKPKQCPSGLYFDIMMPCWNEDPDVRPTFECLEKSLLSYDVEADQKEESVTVRALQGKTTDEEGDLSFKKGDIIVDCAVCSDSDGWSQGTLDGKTGFFPSNFVVQIQTDKA